VVADLEERVGHQLHGPLGVAAQPFAPGEEGRRNVLPAQRVHHRGVVAGHVVGQFAQIEGQGDDLFAVREHPADRAAQFRGQRGEALPRRGPRRRGEIGGFQALARFFRRGSGQLGRGPERFEHGPRTEGLRRGGQGRARGRGAPQGQKRGQAQAQRGPA
jgi:hypothetical protein